MILEFFAGGGDVEKSLDNERRDLGVGWEVGSMDGSFSSVMRSESVYDLVLREEEGWRSRVPDTEDVLGGRFSCPDLPKVFCDRRLPRVVVL